MKKPVNLRIGKRLTQQSKAFCAARSISLSDLVEQLLADDPCLAPADPRRRVNLTLDAKLVARHLRHATSRGASLSDRVTELLRDEDRVALAAGKLEPHAGRKAGRARREAQRRKQAA